MAMARYQVDAKLELSAACAPTAGAAPTPVLQTASANPGGFDIWNNPFNVDWSTDLGGGVYKGYSATLGRHGAGRPLQGRQVGRLGRHGLPGRRSHGKPDRRGQPTRPLNTLA